MGSDHGTTELPPPPFFPHPQEATEVFPPPDRPLASRSFKFATSSCRRLAGRAVDTSSPELPHPHPRWPLLSPHRHRHGLYRRRRAQDASKHQRAAPESRRADGWAQAARDGPGLTAKATAGNFKQVAGTAVPPPRAPPTGPCSDNLQLPRCTESPPRSSPRPLPEARAPYLVPTALGAPGGDCGAFVLTFPCAMLRPTASTHCLASKKSTKGTSSERWGGTQTQWQPPARQRMPNKAS